MAERMFKTDEAAILADTTYRVADEFYAARHGRRGTQGWARHWTAGDVVALIVRGDVGDRYAGARGVAPLTPVLVQLSQDVDAGMRPGFLVLTAHGWATRDSARDAVEAAQEIGHGPAAQIERLNPIYHRLGIAA